MSPCRRRTTRRERLDIRLSAAPAWQGARRLQTGECLSDVPEKADGLEFTIPTIRWRLPEGTSERTIVTNSLRLPEAAGLLQAGEVGSPGLTLLPLQRFQILTELPRFWCWSPVFLSSPRPRGISAMHSRAQTNTKIHSNTSGIRFALFFVNLSPETEQRSSKKI
jgi:hypothetical protein